MTKMLFILFLIAFCIQTNAQENLQYNLGQGVVVFPFLLTPDFVSNPVLFYKDSAFGSVYTNLQLEKTTCPTCFGCEESDSNYQGSIRPLFCNLFKTMGFVCNKVGIEYYEIFIDTMGTKVYLPKQHNTFYTWDAFMKLYGKKGGYFTFNKQWDSTVLYNKVYDLNNLPKPNKELMVGVHLKSLDNLNFYPVSVQGYWMKLKAMEQKKFIGCYWIIWRTKKEWLHGFQRRVRSKYLCFA